MVSPADRIMDCLGDELILEVSERDEAEPVRMRSLFCAGTEEEMV